MKANLLLIAATLLLAFSACNKVSEDIQRDVIIPSDSLTFSIPPMATLRDSVIIDGLATSVSIADKIDSLEGENFSVDNIDKVRISNFSLTFVSKFKDSIDVKNNFSNISYIMVSLNSGTKRDSLAKVQNTSSIDVVSTSLALTPVMITPELLKDYLKDGNLKYSMVVRPRKVTTDTIKAKMSVTYILTLKK